jgi:hypothetical protein
MANTFLNTSWVSMDILRLLLNKLVAAEYFNRSWEKDFKKEYAVGSQITVKFPSRPTVTHSMGYDPQSLDRVSTTISLDQWLQCSFEWDDYEAAVKLERTEEELRENYFEPAAAALAQDIDSICAKFAYQNTSNVVGALGIDPTSVSTYYGARQRLKEKACPPGKMCALISSSMMATLGTNITSIFHPSDEIDKMWKEGAIGKLAAMNFFESNSLYSHTAGTWAGVVSANGANQSGTSITINCTAGDTFNVGDKFNLAVVNQVNPQTRRIPGKAVLQQFTVTQALTGLGSGNAADVLNFLPPIYGPGSKYQNVDALPLNAAALTLWPGTTSPNGKAGTVGLALSRFAFALIGAKLYVPKAVEDAGMAQDPETGLSIRKVKAWDPVRTMQINRLDGLIGTGNLYQDNAAVCIAGA